MPISSLFCSVGGRPCIGSSLFCFSSALLIKQFMASVAGSDAEAGSSEEDRRRRKRKRKEEERQRRKDKERERKRKRRKEREEREDRKRRKKKKKKNKDKGKLGAVTNSWGKYGIIRETDMWLFE